MVEPKISKRSRDSVKNIPKLGLLLLDANGVQHENFVRVVNGKQDTRGGEGSEPLCGECEAVKVIGRCRGHSFATEPKTQLRGVGYIHAQGRQAKTNSTYLLAEDAAHEVRDELGVCGILVVQLAGHLHHLTPLPLPDRQEV